MTKMNERLIPNQERLRVCLEKGKKIGIDLICISNLMDLIILYLKSYKK